MAFEKYETRVPTSIGLIRISLIDKGTGVSGQEGGYEVELLDQFDDPIIFNGSRGDLVPHLTPTQITNIQAFLDQMRTLAEELLI